MYERKKRFFGAVFIDIVGMPLTMTITIIVTPLYFNFISNEEFGYWTAILELMSLLTLFNAGLGFFIIQTVAGIETNNMGYTKSMMSSILLVQLLILLIMSIACLTLYWILPSIKNFKNSDSLVLPIYFIMSINLIISSVGSYQSFILQGQNKVIHTNFLALLNKLLVQILPIIFMTGGIGLLSFPLTFIIASTFLLMILSYFSFDCINRCISFSAISFERLKEITAFSARTFLGGTSYYILNFTDSLIIANFVSNASVTIYILTLKLSSFLRFIPARILSISMPVLAQLYVENNFEKLQDLLLKFFKLGFRFGLFTFTCIAFLNETFVIQWVGADKYGGSFLSLFAALICLRESIFPVLSTLIFSTKEVKWFNYILFFEALLNLLLSILLVKIWGINGVALATVLSTSVFSTCYGLYKTAKVAKMPTINYLKPFLEVIGRSFPSLCVLFLISFCFKDYFSWILFLSAIALAGIVNITFFEGFRIFQYRNLSFKEIVHRIIEDI